VDTLSLVASDTSKTVRTLKLAGLCNVWVAPHANPDHGQSP